MNDKKADISAKKKKSGRTKTIDIEFTQGDDRFDFYFFLGNGVLVYGSNFAISRKGVAFDSPVVMMRVADAMKSFAENWKKEKVIADAPTPTPPLPTN